MVKRRKARPISGVLLLNKSKDMTSNRALQRARGIFNARKAGHTGSLDPLATGLLPVCFGEATKFSRYLLQADKSYQAQIVLGETTNTADSDGEVELSCDASHISLAEVEAVLPNFRGNISQVPPMFSALKHEGKPLYKLARQGIMLEREPRSVKIHSLELRHFEQGERALLDIDVKCSKGTYIRSLAVDIGEQLGVGGHISVLHRTQVDKFSVSHAVSLDDLQERLAQANANVEALDELMLPLECMLDHIPSVTLNALNEEHVLRGRHIEISELSSQDVISHGLIRLNGSTGFLGLGEVLEDGTLRPKRMLTEEQHKY